MGAPLKIKDLRSKKPPQRRFSPDKSLTNEIKSGDRSGVLKVRTFTFSSPPHVTPIKAGEKEKTMSAIDFTLLINALAQLVAASAKFLTALRH